MTGRGRRATRLGRERWRRSRGERKKSIATEGDRRKSRGSFIVESTSINLYRRSISRRARTER